MSTSTSSTRADTPREFSGLAAEYGNYDGLGLADLIAKKEITPLELLRAVRQRVDALNPKLNALCHLFFDQAEAQISQGLGIGPFRGVPFVLKDVGQSLAGTTKFPRSSEHDFGARFELNRDRFTVSGRMVVTAPAVFGQIRLQ